MVLSIRFRSCLLALLGSLLVFASTATAQSSVGVTKPLFRFVTDSSLSRTFLTTDFQEGVNRGYTFWDTLGAVVTPPFPGWVPLPNQGLAPMYRWRIDHVSGTNYYYSGGLWSNLVNNPENHNEGIIAYAMFPGAQGNSGLHLHLWYSTSKGYFYGMSAGLTILPGHPPGTYTWQGVAYSFVNALQSPISVCVPQTGCFGFTAPPPPPPPPPPPTCSVEAEQACYNEGGSWRASTCSCTLPVDPCNSQLNSQPDSTQALLPIMPCNL